MYMLDTHALIWTLFDDSGLSPKCKSFVEESSRLCVSIASLWEIAIKQSIGKLELKNSIQEIADDCTKSDIDILVIAPRHLDAIKSLPDIHRDPFDRLIVAQARCEELTIITKDSRIAEYDVQTVWE